MPLLDLADELLQFIAEILELERDISAFARTNHRLYNLLNTYLYRHNVRQLGSSALLWTAIHGQEATAQKLLEEGANVQVTTYGCWTPLLSAAKKGHEAVVKLLLENGAELESKDRYFGRTPLL